MAEDDKLIFFVDYIGIKGVPQIVILYILNKLTFHLPVKIIIILYISTFYHVKNIITKLYLSTVSGHENGNTKK